MYSSSQKKQTWKENGWIALGVITQIFFLVIISTAITSVIWKWIVPVVFQGAVSSNLLPEKITFLQAFKLSILYAILGLTVITSISFSVLPNIKVKEWLKVRALALAVSIPLLLAFAVIAGFLIYLVWGWVITDVFSGAVTLGFLPITLSLWDAILFTTLISVLGITWKIIGEFTFEK